MDKKLLKEGDIIELKAGHTVYYELPAHFVYSNRKGVFDKLAHTEVHIGCEKGGLNTDFLKGKYVVVKTCFEGGGTGHGVGDVYPDGHHVFAEKIVDELDHKITVDFYQSGCFTAMITDITPVGKAKLTYEVIHDTE